MKTKITDTDRLKMKPIILFDQEWGSDSRQTRTLLDIQEKKNEVIWVVEYKNYCHSTGQTNIKNKKSKFRKYLCVGGPFNGQRKASVQLTKLPGKMTFPGDSPAMPEDEEYEEYNACGRNCKESKLFVHRSLIVEQQKNETS